MNYDDVYDDLKKDFENDKSKNKVSLSTYIILFFILLIPLFVFIFTRKPYSFVSSFDNLPEPVQEPISWSVVMSALWKDITIDFVAKYDIDWKVIAIKSFNSVDWFSSRLSPNDFVLWWWILWIQENIDKFERIEDAINPVLFPDLKLWNDVWYNEIWWNFVIDSSYSNNRFVPSDKKTKLSLSKIKEWDRVKIKWYLSHIYSDNGGWSRWPSCVKNANSSCDIIYVTDVTWLREM